MLNILSCLTEQSVRPRILRNIRGRSIVERRGRRLNLLLALQNTCSYLFYNFVKFSSYFEICIVYIVQCACWFQWGFQEEIRRSVSIESWRSGLRSNFELSFFWLILNYDWDWISFTFKLKSLDFSADYPLCCNWMENDVRICEILLFFSFL